MPDSKNKLNKPEASSNSSTVIYIPRDARINFDPTNQNPPEPKYNDRMKILDQDAVKKIVRGIYGSR